MKTRTFLRTTMTIRSRIAPTSLQKIKVTVKISLTISKAGTSKQEVVKETQFSLFSI